MRNAIFAALLCLAVCLCSCAGGAESSADISVESNCEVSNEESDEMSNLIDSADSIISSLDYTNTGKMGDQDGPAFAVYSNTGFSGAKCDIDFRSININTLYPDGRFINAYMFLGIDVYEGIWWQNCVDAGLVWSGTRGGWHLFYNMYEPYNEGTPTWYESSVILPANEVYTLSFELTDDNYALLSVVGASSGITDTAVVEVKGALADGSNTAFLLNVAVDYPENTKLDSDGKHSEDFAAITQASTDVGLYFKNCHISSLSLRTSDGYSAFTDGDIAARSIWPDKTNGFDYAPISVGLFGADEYVIDIDMNR